MRHRKKYGTHDAERIAENIWIRFPVTYETAAQMATRIVATLQKLG